MRAVLLSLALGNQTDNEENHRHSLLRVVQQGPERNAGMVAEKDQGFESELLNIGVDRG